MCERIIGVLRQTNQLWKDSEERGDTHGPAKFGRVDERVMADPPEDMESCGASLAFPSAEMDKARAEEEPPGMAVAFERGDALAALDGIIEPFLPRPTCGTMPVDVCDLFIGGGRLGIPETLGLLACWSREDEACLLCRVDESSEVMDWLVAIPTEPAARSIVAG